MSVKVYGQKSLGGNKKQRYLKNVKNIIIYIMFVKKIFRFAKVKILRLVKVLLRLIKVIIVNLKKIESCLLDLVGETDFKEGEV